MATALIPAKPLDPQDILRILAHEERQRIVRMGIEIQERRFEQALGLAWFKANEERWRRLGYESWEEFLFQDDMLQALSAPMSRGARSKIEGLIWIDLICPEANALGPGRSKVAEALSELRPKIQAALEASPEERESIAAEIGEDVDRYRSMLAREVQAEIQAHRPSPYHLTTNDRKPAIAKVDEESGELDILLVQAEDCDPVGAGRAMARLLKRFAFLMWDEDGIWGQAGEGVWKPLLRWTRADIPYNVREAVARACGAERRL